MLRKAHQDLDQGKGERGRGGAWENGEIWGGAGQILVRFPNPLRIQWQLGNLTSQILNFIMASNDYWEAKPIPSSWPNQFHFILTPSLPPCPVTSCWHSSWGSSGWFRYFRIWWYFKWSFVIKHERQSQEEVGASFLNHFRSKQWQQCSVWSSWRAKTHTFSPSKRCNSFLLPIITMILKKTWF